MITKPIQSITPADIEALVTETVGECRELDFKRELPGSTDKDKRELCADVSSFANSAGGYLLFGIDETDGRASNLVGIPRADADAAMLRIHHVIAAGVDPAVPGVACREIELPSGDVILVVHVPRSWLAPHLVKVNDAFRMYARTSRGKMPLDQQEIRRTFEAAGDLAQSTRRWREERIARILGGDTPTPIQPGAAMVLHLVPFQSVADPHQLSPAELENKTREFAPIAASGWNHRINLDGFLTHGGRSSDPEQEADRTYCQVFRSGRLEAVCASIEGNPGRIASQWYEKALLEASAQYLRSLESLGVSYPMLLFLTLVGVRGITMAVGEKFFRPDVRSIDRDVLLLPELLVNQPPADLPRTMKPVFDSVWNACGIARSLNFNEDGKWVAGPLREVPLETDE